MHFYTYGKIDIGHYFLRDFPKHFCTYGKVNIGHYFLRDFPKH